MDDSSAVTLQLPGLTETLRLYVHGEQDAHVSQRLREAGVWEPYESSLVLDLLQPGDVFLDVGANIGYFSLLAASVVGASGQVFAFEPDPDNYRLLVANADLNGMGSRIDCVEAALTEHAGEGRLFLSDDNLGDHQVFDAGDGRASLGITLCQGSDYLAGRTDRIDLVKVDTQGSEYQVIAGLMPLLRTLDQPPRFIVELTPHALLQAGASGRALVELLATLEQPMWIVDHTKDCLYPSSAGELSRWSDNWEAVPESRGFMNILVGEMP